MQYYVWCVVCLAELDETGLSKRNETRKSTRNKFWIIIYYRKSSINVKSFDLFSNSNRRISTKNSKKKKKKQKRIVSHPEFILDLDERTLPTTAAHGMINQK